MSGDVIVSPATRPSKPVDTFLLSDYRQDSLAGYIVSQVIGQEHLQSILFPHDSDRRACCSFPFQVKSTGCSAEDIFSQLFAQECILLFGFHSKQSKCGCLRFTFTRNGSEVHLSYCTCGYRRGIELIFFLSLGNRRCDVFNWHVQLNTLTKRWSRRADCLLN